MSYDYSNYHRRQFDYNRYSRWMIHPTTETGRERVTPPRSPYAYNARHQPARQPSCWEPPPYQPDRTPYVSRQPKSHPDTPYRSAPPYWSDDTDHRFENLEPAWPRGNDQPYDDDDIDDLGFDDQRQRRTGDRGFHSRKPNFSARDSPQRDRYRREGRNRRNACWDPPGYQQHRHQIDGYDQQFNRPATKAEDPINAKLDRILEAFDKIETWVDATNRRFSKFRSLPQPEPDLDQHNVSAPIRKWAYPPSRNNEAHRTKSDQTPVRQPSCWEPPLMATPAVDQKPPLQHVLDQQSLPSNRRAAEPSAPAAAPPPLLHVDQQPSPSCCHPTTHLRQAGACLELPTTVQQPLLQRPPPLPLPRSDHPPQPSPATPLELLPYSAPRPAPPMHPLSVTVPLLVSNGHSQAVPSSRKKEWQTNLHNADEYGLLKVVPCLHDVVVEEGIVEDKLKENGIGSKGLIGSTDDEASDIFKMIKVTIVRAFDPGICVNFSKHRREFLAMQKEKMDLGDSKKELPYAGVIKCLFATETFRIEPHMPAKKFNWSDEGKRSVVRFTFDPGGDVSQQFLAFNSHRCFVVPTLRTRWISTVGELIRSYLPII